MKPRKGLITRNTYVKYQRSSTHCSKVNSKIKVFKNGSNSKVKVTGKKNNGTHRKVLSQGIFMWNIKAQALTVQKVWARLKFQREWQNDRQDKNNMPLDLWSRGNKNAKIDAILKNDKKEQGH